MKQVERHLREAQASGDYIEVRRKGRGVDDVDGFCTALGEQWFAMATVGNDIRLDGHAFLRLADVRSVEHRGPSDFVPRALRHAGDWPPPPAPTVRLGAVRDLLADAAAAADLVTVHTELLHPGACWIGVPAKYGRTKLHLAEVDPQAAWIGVHKRDLDAITRVDIGGRYEALLSALAGPAPGPERPTESCVVGARPVGHRENEAAGLRR